MISSFRNFAKTKFAGILVFLMIIPFVFWGMGSMFSSGNTNTLVKINNKNISTQDFIDYLNNSGIPDQYISENLDKNIIQEILSGLISTTLLDLEIKDFNFLISENTLSQMIKKNKNFHDDNGVFQRIKYEKFLLENNQTAAGFEQRLKKRELQKNLFDYIGAGTKSPKFLITKLYEEENKKLEIDYINLENFYRKKNSFSNNELKKFIENNKEQLKMKYLDFSYLIINPKNLIGIDEFNQSFFDKIDKIEIDIANGVNYENIISNLDIIPIKRKNFKISSDKDEIEKKIFELRNNNIDIFESGNEYVLYNIENIYEREPDLNEIQTKNEIGNLLFKKSRFDYNQELLKKIKNKSFNNSDFNEMGKDKIKSIKLNSIKDNKKFEINSVKVLYSLPVNSFTLINDENNNIFLAKVKEFENKTIEDDKDKLNEYINKQNSNIKNNMLKSFDLYLNSKYQVDLNQKTIERIKNFFQ